MFVRCLTLTVALVVLVVSPAQAAVTAKVAVSGSRLVVTIKGAKPKAVTLVAAGKSYKLTKGGARCGSKPIAGVAGLAGAAVKLKVRTAAGTKTVSATVPGPSQ